MDASPPRKFTELSRSVSADRMGKLVQEDSGKMNGIHLAIPPMSGMDYPRGKVTSLNAINLASRSGSRTTSSNFYTKKLAETVVEVPVKHIKKLKEQHLGSYQRETKHFCENTTMHGPKRVYKGKNWSLLFWSLMFIASIAALCWQVWSLVAMYRKKTTLSQVSFAISENGLEFPEVTICPFNPIKKSSIDKINATGDFSAELLSYLLETNVEAPALYSSSNKSDLIKGEKQLKKYMQKHPGFDLYSFFKTYGFQCSDIMRWCTFGGRQFDCCSVAKPLLTPIGLCQRMNLRASKAAWMMNQTSPGHNAGLQLILDSQQHEQFDLSDNIVASPLYEHGFRYYVHDHRSVPYLSSEGISVSPGMRVYSALSLSKYILLDVDNWGHCRSDWPDDFRHNIVNPKLKYSSGMCNAICKAQYFFKQCNCSPSAYDIEDRYSVCSPLEVVECIDQFMINGTEVTIPSCNSCTIECENNVYQTFNSYGKDFSAPSMKWLAKKNSSWTPQVIKENFLTINVFFRDLSSTEYTQVKSTSLTELLSNIGGNMGMFLGMSTITITEITLFLCKIFWIAFSRSRRNYMQAKKEREENQNKEVAETVREFKKIRSFTDLHSISNFKMMDPSTITDFYLQPSPPNRNSLGSTTSETEQDKETDSGHATDR